MTRVLEINSTTDHPSRIRVFGDRLLWKRGVTRVDSFARWALAMEAEHRGWWPFAYTMLDDLQRCYRESDESLLQRLYSSMRAGDGVYKITHAGRFRELDRWLVAWLGVQPPPEGLWRIHDMAASNGITSLELLHAIGSTTDVELLVSDYFTEIRIVEIPESSWRVVFDAADRPLQFVGKDMVLSTYRKEPRRFPLNRLLQVWLHRRVLPRAKRILRDQYSPLPASSTERIREISLFHPSCIREAKDNTRFLLARRNILDEGGHKAHIVRVMNFLTLKHLSTPDFREALATVTATVVENGLLIQGRNIDEVDGALRATVFQRRNGQFHPIQDLGGGSEERELIAGLAPCPEHDD